jgi:hypothetical protein
MCALHPQYTAFFHPAPASTSQPFSMRMGAAASSSRAPHDGRQAKQQPPRHCPCPPEKRARPLPLHGSLP